MTDSNAPGLFPEWEERELQRFATGEYKAIPTLDALGDLVYPPSHHVHLSVTDSELDYVAYTPTPQYGAADRQVRLRFGKYLKKTFESISDAVVQSAVTELRAKLARTAETIHFATDIETINEIFETPLHACGREVKSCMHGKWDGDAVRPYHVYANSPDVAVAYVRKGDAIIARSVVSTKDSVWVRPYSIDGDETLCAMLCDMLKAQGYKHGDLEGNRLTRVMRRGKPALPYLDGDAQEVVSEGSYWRVVSYDGDYECTNTDGTGSEIGPQCEHCGESEDDCQCSYCDCCEQRYCDGCEQCSSCERCDRCTEHDRCGCSRCSHCGELNGGYRSDMCECDICPECDELCENCECEDESEDSETPDTATVGGVL